MEEKGPEAEAGGYTLTNNSQGNDLLQDNCTAYFENKPTQNTKTASKPGLYPKLAQALELAKTIYQQQEETQRRLARAGWTDNTMLAMLSNTEFKSVWDEWVCRPGSPTEKDWTDTMGRLISMFEGDVVACSQQYRERDREQALSKELNILLIEVSLPVQFTIDHPRSSMWDYASPSLYQPPFPSFAHICDWAIIRDLWKSDRAQQEMLVQFGEQRQTIKASMVEWKREIESHLANLVHGKLKSRAINCIVQPTMLRTESTAKAFDGYTATHKMLLRGDTLFYDTGNNCWPPIPMTYSNILHENGLIASPEFLKPHPTLCQPVSLGKYGFYLEAHLVAQHLMTLMHIPDVSYLLLVGLGADFQCERCLDAQQVTWIELVQHYIACNRFFKNNIEGLVLLGENIVYRNVHDTNIRIDRPMFGYCSINPSRELGGQMAKRRKCLLCAQIPGVKDVIAPEWAIFRHLQDVHAVARPRRGLHYALDPDNLSAPADDFGGYGLPPYDSVFFY
ncbi:hypothetical protein RHS01_11326 [Rhizoctonia solani]|uniref:Uncharacterized protein n=2 Tax=Rhizoctonia solani TaxID=456999 RepID=A0A8H7LZQ0_9AGAM|nr:hypothetical protein RHS01_11326 [Rhizoctonia solani]